MKSIRSITIITGIINCILFIHVFDLKAQSCLPGGAYFTSQEQINNFSTANSGCQVIEGSVSITGEDIMNLQGLSGIIEIQGDMFINNSVVLTNLEGLDKLTSIQGAVRIQNNTGLISFEGLSNLKTIGGDYFYVSDSPLCQNMEGLDALDSIAGIVHIYDMPGLKNLSGMENVSYIGDRLSIFRCDSLLSLDGLNGLNEVGAFDISENPELTSVKALDHPIQINAQLVITDNPKLLECKVEAFCNYFIDPPSFIAFSNNGDGCSDKAQLELECATNSTHSEANKSLKVFPNPATDFLILDIPQNSKIEWIRMYNMQGKPVHADLYHYQIDIGAFSPGVYFGQVMFEENLHHFSVIKN